MLTEKTLARRSSRRIRRSSDESLTINDRRCTVIGVLPASFDFASVFAPGASADLFVPFALSERHNRNGNTLAVIGRLKPGVSIDGRARSLVALGKQLTAEFPRAQHAPAAGAARSTSM